MKNNKLLFKRHLPGALTRAERGLILSKRSQAEVITTILLILIGIGAVVLLGAFVLNLVKTNLVGTDCFVTAGQFTINTDPAYTYYDSAANKLFISIERGEKEFNLSGIVVSAGTQAITKSYTIKINGSSAGVAMLGGSTIISLPEPSEIRTYEITLGASSGITSVTTAKIVPILLATNKPCAEGSDEKSIPSK